MCNEFSVELLRKIRIMLASFPIVITMQLSMAMADDLQFAERIGRAEATVVDLTAETDLLTSTDFLLIWENPRRFLPDALKFLERPEGTEQQKTIVVLSLQRLGLDDYLTLSEAVLRLFLNNAMPRRVFERTVFQEYSWSTILVENYSDPRVRDLYSRIKSAKILPRESETQWDEVYVDSILSGDALKYVEQLRSDGVLK